MLGLSGESGEMGEEGGIGMKGIKFNDDMVRSILKGRKTQTRRPMKPQPEINGDRINFSFRKGSSHSNLPFPCSDYSLAIRKCPYGKVGDRLFVKETFCLEHQVESDQGPPFNDGRPIRWFDDGIPVETRGFGDTWTQPHYRATDPMPELYYEDSDGDEPIVKWCPPQNMPEWASRITLEITDIRVERIAEISPRDVRKEGFGTTPLFMDAWNSIYGEKGFGWHTFCWVWVIGFKRVEEGKE